MPLCILAGVSCANGGLDSPGFEETKTRPVLPESVELSAAGTRWFMRPGFDPAWTAPNLDLENNSAWREVAARGDFYRTSIGRLPSGWVTLRTPLPSNVRQWLRSAAHDSSGAAWPLAIYAGRSGDIAQYYLGGVALSESGVESTYGFRLLRVLPRIEDPNADLTLVLFSPNDRVAWHVGDIRIGPAENIFARARNLELVSMLLIGTYLLIGLYHLLLSIWRWSDRHNLYFGVFCVCVSVYWFSRMETSQEWLPLGGASRTRLELLSLYSIGPLFMQSLAQLLVQRVDRIAVIYGVVCAVLGFVAIFAPFSMALATLPVWHGSVFFIIPYAIYFVVREARFGNLDAKYLVAGVVIQLFATVYDILVARSIIETPQIGRYTFLVFVLGIAGVLANRFMRVHNEVEELNATLEQKVLTRTSELKDSLDKVQTLKQKQDGDYFLTSLLLKPLGGNYNDLRSVEIQILERQYKRFLFRKRELELGGDFSTSHTISLRNGPCGIFINGDAMGKSMQGAGGALVLGTVFKAILQRTLRSPVEQKKPPEFWLRDMFEELQAVFESFDGSMLVSLVAGIIEERTGMFYWINAEHPRMVLYRFGRAEFLEADPQIRKLGVQYFEDQSLQIRSRRLEVNDIVISGSDGRDDLLIGFDADGGRLINENELEFLRRVEDGDGLPTRIIEAMARQGSLTDDLSLIRISFREDFSLLEHDQQSAEESGPAYVDESSTHERLVEQLNKHFENQEWRRTLEVGDELDRVYGVADETLYRMAIASDRSENRALAVLHGSRYLLRAPDSSSAPEIRGMLGSP